jgi:signal peptidase I
MLVSRNGKEYTRCIMDTDHAFEEKKDGAREKNKWSPPAPRLRRASEYLSLAIYSIVALTLALSVRFFIAAPYLVQGASMYDTFDQNDYLIIDRISYRFEEPKRGDVIVFRFPQDPSRSFIKRVIGLPGETVSMEGKVIRIINDEKPKGFIIDEPYLVPSDRDNSMRITIGVNEYFVLGDNRDESADSRIWGLLPHDNIIGRAVVRLYPLNNIDVNPGSVSY